MLPEEIAFVWVIAKVRDALESCKSPVLLPANRMLLLCPPCSVSKIYVLPSLVVPLRNTAPDWQPSIQAVYVALPASGVTVNVAVVIVGYPLGWNVGTTIISVNGDDAVAEVTVREVTTDWPAYEPVIVTGWLPKTEPVVAVKGAFIEPAGTNTEVGTDTALELEASDTRTPPAGAGPERTTVPTVELPLPIRFMRMENPTLFICTDDVDASSDITTFGCVCAPPTVACSGRSPTPGLAGIVRFS
jgi:hypothetical protein